MAREVAGYQLEEHAFADGVSTVWHARSSADPSHRATVRVFDIPEGGDFAGPLFAFRQDTEAATALTHDHLVQTLDVGWRGGDHTYVVSPHMTAVPLRDQLRDGPLAADQALALLGPLAAALDMAAEMELPHGAVHPLSIWVAWPEDDDGRPRALLSGFGLHHILRVLAVRHRAGGVIDDFLYIAPELLRGGRPTNRSDQYSLAGALLHAATGHPPYERDGLAALFSAHLFSAAGGDSSPPPRDEHDEAFLEIVTRGLAKNPDHRFDSCQHFVAALEQWSAAAAGSEVAASPVPPSSAEPSPVPSPEPSQEPAPEPAPPLDVAHATAMDPEPATVLEPEADAPAAAPVPAPEPDAVPAPPRHVVRPLPVRPRRRRTVRTRVAMIAGAGAIVGVVAVLVVLARIAPPPEDAVPSADARALAATDAPSPPTEPAPDVRWRQALPAPASELYVTSVGVVAVTPTQVVVVDPDTGGVLDLIDSSEPTVVTDDGGLVTATADGLQAYDIEDGSLQWESEISGTRPPAVSGGTLYGVSNDAVPQLIATDAQSGQRLWQFPGEEPAFPADTAVAPTDDFVYLADSQAMYGILPEGATVGVDTPVIDANEQAREPLHVWRVEVKDEVWLSSLRAVADGVVVAERSGNVCMRGRADGDAVWCLRVRGADGVEPALFTTDTQAFVVTPSAVTAIDARTGEEQWVQTGEWGSAVLGDGRLVVISADGTVAALSVGDGQAQTLHVTPGAGAPLGSESASGGDTVGGSEPVADSEPLGATEPADASAPPDGGVPVGGEPTVVAVDGDMLYAALDDGALVSIDMAEQLVRR